MDTKRKKIRAFVIGAIILTAVIAAIVTLRIDPADYRKEIGKSIQTAQELLDGAQVGNENGQYAQDNLLWLQTEVERSEEMVEDAGTEIDQFREQSKAIKEEIQRFDDRKNENSASQEEIASLQKEKKTYTAQLSLEDGSQLEWSMDCADVQEPAAINPDVTQQGFYREQVDTILADNGASGVVLTFLHNGDLPGRADITLELQKEAEPLHLYEYRPDSQSLVYVSPVTVQGKTAEFSVASGGTWALCQVGEADGDPEDGSTLTSSGAQESSSAASQSEDEGSSSAAGSSSSSSNRGPSGSSGTFSDGTSHQADGSTGSGGSSSGGSASSTTSSVPSSMTGSSSSQPAEETLRCTIEIRCDTILNNRDLFKPEKLPYVPSDGVILQEVTVEFTQGETAFDILQRVTRSNGIQMEFEHRALYSGAYIEGIGHLYEHDGGDQSGWMYQINGWFPNYGCSQYKMKNGDKIVWCYTFNNGKDVGDQYFTENQ